MKKSKVLATTTLAGALLFTGVGATHHANAAESEVNVDNAIEITKQITAENGFDNSKINFNHPTDKGDYIDVAGNNASGAGGALYRVYKDGTVQWSDGLAGGMPYEDLGKYDLAKNTNSTQSTDNTQAATNNETTNNEVTNNNTTAATDNNVSTQENNTQSTQSNEAQSTAQALPETGGQSNSGLVTIVASVLLAAGSLLAFRRTSNSK
ncbi:LPXTG cell wall anchor domain-containing protein [Staphylococcus hominis]|uniref:LPXTG cell wall anchor domain-containing protein n=1 Tax=Staphylococcus hominis TaxID=1290 RepID=UPI001F562D19|nr:LPXTG cell wall anchor domain-containing protein [Staphylococcus hominis]MCI2919696.1 LPXTG cell wall anchor domain-containing protein [Staphylococcus hominis]MDS3915230.1 LPXTG cell wall anchor domain-containing protein [Staphylococcus hominis]